MQKLMAVKARTSLRKLRVVERFAARSGELGLMAQTGQNRDQTNGEETWPTIAL
jgi:hypothetical protein